MRTPLPRSARLVALLVLLVVCVPAVRSQAPPAPESKEATRPPTRGELADRLRALEEAGRVPPVHPPGPGAYGPPPGLVPEGGRPADSRPTATPARGARPASISDSPVPDYGDGL